MSNLQNEAHKDEQRSRRRTPGGSAHVTTNTRVSKGSAAEGRMGGEGGPGGGGGGGSGGGGGWRVAGGGASGCV